MWEYLCERVRPLVHLGFGFGLAAALSIAGRAEGGDGRFEINQTCATQTGCFLGDTPGFPVTLIASGSYLLTSELAVPDANTSAIVVNVGGLQVEIDLNGFGIRGPVVCSGLPTVCTPTAGTGDGIADPTLGGISVRNGFVRGMGNRGLQLGPRAVVTDVTVQSNRTLGMTANQHTTIRNVKAIANGGRGFSLSNFTSIENCKSTDNGSDGILLGVGAVVSRCIVMQNAGAGIVTSTGSTIVDNVVQTNGGIGISVGAAATVSSNSVRDNDLGGIAASTGASTISSNTVASNGAAGVIAGPGSIVQGNGITGNTGVGLSVGTGAGFRENVINGNVGGTVTGTGVSMGSNLCDGGAACP